MGWFRSICASPAGCDNDARSLSTFRQSCWIARNESLTASGRDEERDRDSLAGVPGEGPIDDPRFVVRMRGKPEQASGPVISRPFFT